MGSSGRADGADTAKLTCRGVSERTAWLSAGRSDGRSSRRVPGPRAPTPLPPQKPPQGPVCAWGTDMPPPPEPPADARAGRPARPAQPAPAGASSPQHVWPSCGCRDGAGRGPGSTAPSGQQSWGGPCKGGVKGAGGAGVRGGFPTAGTDRLSPARGLQGLLGMVAPCGFQAPHVPCVWPTPPHTVTE